ncbi:MAG: DUF4139 domain-containing protein [Bacteroidia bacterium]|nr:DUF4139 domain-containing protein [Bacteroidia bacterium]
MLKKSLLIGSLLGIISTFSLAASEKIIRNSKVNQVTIFLNSARVERSSSIQLEGGRQLIVFGGLSPYVDARSLTVTGRGDFSILNSRYELNYLSGIAEIPELKKLEDSLETLQYQLELLLNRKSVANEEQALLLANKTIGGTNTGLNSRELELVADIFRKRLTKLKDDLLDLSQKEKKQREKVQKIQSQINSYRIKRDQPSGSVLIEVLAATSVKAAFEISYQVNNISWSPYYEIRSNNDSEKIAVVFKASVTQTTGEDWKDTKVKLSTYNPIQGNYKPELYPWYLRFAEPVTFYGLRLKKSEAQSGVEELRRPDLDSSGEKNLEATSLDQQILVNDYNIFNTYDIEIPYDILSDGKEYLLQIRQAMLTSAQKYFSVPKMETDVFVVANITGWQELNMLPGRAAVYYDGAYTGETFINPAVTNDTLQVALGRDKRIAVKREQIRELTSNQFLGSNRLRTLTFDLVIKNNKSRPISLDIEDQLPVSQNKDIEVRIIETSGADLNKESGKLTWKLELQPGEQTKKRISFSVKYPKDKQIAGL